MTSALSSDVDPMEAHFRRDPLPKAGARVVAFGAGELGVAERVASGLAELLGKRGRVAETVVCDATEGYGRGLEHGLETAVLPLVLVTTAIEPWTAAHLDPLLAAIEHCDHVIGRRPAPGLSGVSRWLGGWPARAVYGVPVVDAHSPCTLHRLDKLREIPLQSQSAFMNIEIIAKATFLRHLLDEVKVPPLAGMHMAVSPADARLVFRRPVFVRVSGPAKEAEREEERDGRPGGEDDERHGDGTHIGSLEDHEPQRLDELGQRQGLDEPLRGGREVVGREEDPREEPLR
jgi:hypothetical protein